MGMFHTAQGRTSCPGRDRVQGGAWRRSTTRSVVLDTSGGWLKLSNELQSIGMHTDMEIGLIAAGGCCSIGVDQTLWPGSTVRPEDVVDQDGGFDWRSD